MYKQIHTFYVYYLLLKKNLPCIVYMTTAPTTVPYLSPHHSPHPSHTTTTLPTQYYAYTYPTHYHHHHCHTAPTPPSHYAILPILPFTIVTSTTLAPRSHPIAPTTTFTTPPPPHHPPCYTHATPHLHILFPILIIIGLATHKSS